MITTPEIKRIYEKLQRQLFYLIPEKWDRIYLYASVEEQVFKLETGELFFYYFPKGILKKNPVNVYEIPGKFNLNEKEYIELVENLYATVKKLRQVYKAKRERLWSSITIRLVDIKFEIEFNYENLTNSRYNNLERHIIWKYKNLGMSIGSFNREERNLILEYSNDCIAHISDTETYAETIYKRPTKNVIEYDRERVQEEYKPEQKQKTEKKKERTKEPEEEMINYVEDILVQRKSVKSQILKRL